MTSEKEGGEQPKKAVIGRTLGDVLSELFSRHGLKLVRPVLIGCGIAGFLWIWAYVRDAEDRAREVYQERLDAANIQLQDTFVKTASLTRTQMQTLIDILALQKQAQGDLQKAQLDLSRAQEMARMARDAESEATRRAGEAQRTETEAREGLQKVQIANQQLTEGSAAELKKQRDDILRLNDEVADAERRKRESQRQIDELAALLKTMRSSLDKISSAARVAEEDIPAGLRSTIETADEKHLVKAALLLHAYFRAPGPDSGQALQALVGSSESEVEEATRSKEPGSAAYWLRLEGARPEEWIRIGVGSEDPTSCRDMVTLTCREGTVRDVSCIRRVRALSLPDPEDWNRWILVSVVEFQESPPFLESAVFRIADRRRPETWTLGMLQDLDRRPEGTQAAPPGGTPGLRTLTPEESRAVDPGLLETLAEKDPGIRESVAMLARAKAIAENPQAWKQLHLQPLSEGLRGSFMDLVTACVKQDSAGARSLLSPEVDEAWTGILAALLLRKEFKITEVDRDSNRMMQQSPAAADGGSADWVVHAQGTSDGLYDRSVRMEFERKAAPRSWILVGLGDDALVGTRR